MQRGGQAKVGAGNGWCSYTPRSATDRQEPPGARREARNGLSLRVPRGANFADTWMSEFWPPDL